MSNQQIELLLVSQLFFQFFSNKQWYSLRLVYKCRTFNFIFGLCINEIVGWISKMVYPFIVWIEFKLFDWNYYLSNQKWKKITWNKWFAFIFKFN